jgi:hypothetical protein
MFFGLRGAFFRLAAVFAFATTGALHGGTLSFAPSAQTVTHPASPAVDIVATLPPTIGGFDLSISFDASLITAASATYGPSLGSGPLEVFELAPALGAGTIGLYSVSLLPVPNLLALQGSGPLTLATLVFNTRGLRGTSPLDFTLFSISDVDGVTDISASFSAVSGSITITALPVPEPGPFALLASAVAVAALTRRRVARTR